MRHCGRCQALVTHKRRPARLSRRQAMAWLAALLALLVGLSWTPQPSLAQDLDTSPPVPTIKLIFIHHSCGENWLSDDNGGLGQALGSNNYFVSDTNYGWGPDSIGDRTDITNWPEWFTGPDSGRYLAALYAESGQNSSYSRWLTDPGGENRVIMFKSCFPNSNLEGSPGDPPERGDGLTVGNAKAIYNELLGYFATRPDKLFVAITAPPVQDDSLAANARAFNTWLTTEWLAGYEGTNVVVFDFYTVLTGPDHHHRVQDGTIEYVFNPDQDTLYYPSEDDHPSRAGNEKATEEFVPLLNAYVRRWLAGEAAQAPVAEVPPAQATEAPAGEDTGSEPPAVDSSAGAQGLGPGAQLDGLEGESAWLAYTDEAADTTTSCSRDPGLAYGGSASLRIEYDVAPAGWSSCSREFVEPGDWSAAQGLAVAFHAEQVGQPIILAVMQLADDGNWLRFDYRTTTTQEAVDGWQMVASPWADFIQPPWEGDGTARFDPTRGVGVALLFEAPEDGRLAGVLWADEVGLTAESAAESAAEPAATEPAPSLPVAQTEATAVPAEEAAEPEAKSVCPLGVLLPLAVVGGAGVARRAGGRRRG